MQAATPKKVRDYAKKVHDADSPTAVAKVKRPKLDDGHQLSHDDIVNKRGGYHLIHETTIKLNIYALAWYLVADRVNANLTDHKGRTALHHLMLTAKGMPENPKIKRIMTLLLLFGADPKLTFSHSKQTVNAYDNPPCYTSDHGVMDAHNYLHLLVRELANLKIHTGHNLSRLQQLSRQGPFLLQLIGATLKAAYNEESIDECQKEIFEQHSSLQRLDALLQQSNDVEEYNFDATGPATGGGANIIRRAPATDACENITASCSITGPLRARLTAADDHEQLVLAEDLIIHHIHMRVQLSFYLLCAYYNSRLSLLAGKTSGQHGEGDNLLGTQACHSSLLTNMKEQWRWSEEANIEEARRDPEAYRNKRYIEHIETPYLANSCYLLKALNSTVELPRAVNDYDRLIEGQVTNRGSARRARVLLEGLVQNTALGFSDPLTALESFLTGMLGKKGILARIKPTDEASAAKKYLHSLGHRTIVNLLAREEDDSVHLRRTYTSSLLFMRGEQREMAQSCDQEKLHEICEEHFSKIREEILASR